MDRKAKDKAKKQAMAKAKKRGYHGRPTTASLAKGLHKKLMATCGEKCFTIDTNGGAVNVIMHQRRYETPAQLVVDAMNKHRYDVNVTLARYGVEIKKRPSKTSERYFQSLQRSAKAE